MHVFEKSTFLFVVCQVGAEPALKTEISRMHPELKFAYSRPGFVTFKYTGETSEKVLAPDFQLRSVFGRAYGVSIAKLTAEDGSPEDLAKKIYELAGDFVDSPLSPDLHLHVWERDRYPPGEEPMGFIPGTWTASAIKAIEEQAPPKKNRKEKRMEHFADGSSEKSSGNSPEESPEKSKVKFKPRFLLNQLAPADSLVLDLILVEENEWWLGVHKNPIVQNFTGHGPASHTPYAGGNPHVALHAHAPSRAYVKLEEALLWSGAPIQSGDTAVEIGSAPGGASFALLERGLNVIGIDPAEMAPAILKSKRFQHIQKTVANVPREELPESVEWLLLDMNVAPSVSIFAVDRLATRLMSSLLGLLLTVKLNQWKIAGELPGILEHIKLIGMVKVKATQLSSNGQEVFIYGLTRKGAARRL